MLFEVKYAGKKRYALNPIYVTDIVEEEDGKCLIYLVNNDNPIHVNMTFDEVLRFVNS